MKVVRIGAVAKESFSGPIFTGQDVARQVLVRSKDFNVNIVHFGKGVRSKFHTHSTDQVLIVTIGTGYAATEKEKSKVAVGDVIVIPAGEKHWHGAGPESAFSHIAITRPGVETHQLEG